MTEESTVATDPRESLNLKLDEPEVSPDDPWGDDVLNRAQIAGRLTNLIRTQSVPLVVSVDGYWGTGKTFMLKRWQKDLENQGFRAIYFNAWEDDFCDDPLLAIIGQLSEYFDEDENFGAKARRAFEIAIPLLRQNAMNIATGMLERQAGISGLSLEVEQNGESNRDLLQEYRDQRATKVNLKDRMTELSNEVMENTGHPLVFIIDELDRCRPTFAVELLERVKHIFDVPNLVFVFGINRDELCKSLQSVYGDIGTEVYVRRFFDFEFTLPDGDSIEFCKHLFDKFGLGDDSHSGVPELWSYFGLSLRDMDYCTRLLCLTVRNLEPDDNNPRKQLLGLLIALKFANPPLYRKIYTGDWRAKELLDYIHSQIPQDDGQSEIAQTLADIEASLYVIDAKRTSGATDLADRLTYILNRSDGSIEFNIPDGFAERTHNALRQINTGVFSFKDIHDHIQMPYGSPQNSNARMLRLLFSASIVAFNNRSNLGSIADLISWMDIYQENIRR